MGRMEQESKRRTKRNEVRKIILETVRAAGIISVAIIAPNVLGAMAKVGLIPHGRQGEIVRRSIDRMYAQGLLRHVGSSLALTREGERSLRKLQLKTFRMNTPLRWDKKWRILVFDIPERQRRLRDGIRRTLLANGFVRLQDSVWIYPYDCEDWVNLWKAELRVGKELLYLIADTVEGDSGLKRKFNL